MKLKLQADALTSTQLADSAARQQRFRDDAAAAQKEKNLRAAALALEQPLQYGDDANLHLDGATMAGLFRPTLEGILAGVRAHFQKLGPRRCDYLFLVGGLLLGTIGFVFGLVLAGLRIFAGDSPSSGTVMLAVLPFLTGLQLLLTALILDVNNEKRP